MASSGGARAESHDEAQHIDYQTMAALQTLQADSSMKDSITNASGIDDCDNRIVF